MPIRFLPFVVLAGALTLTSGCASRKTEPSKPSTASVDVPPATVSAEGSSATEPSEAPPRSAPDGGGIAAGVTQRLAEAGVVEILGAPSDSGPGGLGSPGTGAPPQSTFTTHGDLDRAIIQRTIRRHERRIRYCYERSLVKDPKLKGKVVVRFVIGPSGAVKAVKVVQALTPDLDGCIEQAFLRIRFPKPKGGGIVTVSYPFIFEPI